jgi:membrane protease YdiL (CAAX protease family)
MPDVSAKTINVISTWLFKPIVPISLICASAIALIALHAGFVGWLIMALATTVVMIQPMPIRRHLVAVVASLIVLALLPIYASSIEIWHVVSATAGIWIVAFIPYVYLEVIHKESVVKFSFHHGRRWYKTEVLYIFFTAAVGYILLPLYFATTGQADNWQVVLTFAGISTLLFGLLTVGLWDEIYFIASVLGVFKKHLPFWQANIAQSIIFVSFLYELGFRNWVIIPTMAFALIQGIVFHKTKSLLYAITIHLTFDMVLFVALIHAHYPNVFPVFITG